MTTFQDCVRKQHAAIAKKLQIVPDASTDPNFPTFVLRPSETHNNHIEWRASR